MYREYWNHWVNRTNLYFETEGSGGAGGVVDEAAKKIESEKEKKTDEEPTDEEVAELEQAQNLLKVLKDPVARKALVQSLAEREGITADSTKSEKKAAIRNLETIIKEELGSEYSVLGERLHKILTGAFDLFESEKVKPVNERMTTKEETEIRNEASKAYDEVSSQYSNAKELEAKVAELAKEIKPGTQSPKIYFERLIKIAASEKEGFTLKKVSVKDGVVKDFNLERRKMNRTDAASRLASEGAEDTAVSKASRPMTLTEAIEAGAKAAEGLFKK